MRLLFTSSAFPRPGDPARAPYNLRLCEALAEEHDVAVVSPLPWPIGAWAPGRHEVGTLTDVWYPLFVYPPRILRDSHAWCMAQSIRRAVRAALSGARPDAVISYWTYPDGAAAADLARRFRVPVVMMVGGSDVEVLARRTDHRQRIVNTLAQADAVVATSRSLRDTLRALGVPDARIAVVRRGVDLETFHPSDRQSARQSLGISPTARIFLWVGRLEAVKGPDVLVEALATIGRADRPEWQCYLVGDGSLRNTVGKQLVSRGLRDRVTFLGTLAPSELARWYQAADAVVISSRSEGLPNVLAEAKACGIPVLATNVGGVMELIDEGDRLVPPHDPAALGEAIDNCLRTAVPPSKARVMPSAPMPSWRDSAAALTRIVERAVIQRQRSHLERRASAAPAPSSRRASCAAPGE